MLRNYLKIAFRNLFRTRVFSFINISGLMTGIAASLLICLWIYNEVSYDRFHKNAGNLYQAWNRGVYDNAMQCWNSVPQPLAAALKSGYPGVENSCRTDSRWFVTRAGDKNFSTKALVVDPAFLSMFTFPLLKGNAATALDDVHSIVITEQMAAKMFGGEDPMGKTILIDRDNFMVTGVIKDLEKNSRFDFEYLIPWKYYTQLGYENDNWRNNSVNVYVQLREGVTEKDMNVAVRNITRTNTAGKEDVDIFLHPLHKWHLYSRFENGIVAGGRIEVVRLFGAIAGFILLIACINFMNLSTARSEKRAKEVGIRKVAGAMKRSLIGQFILESVVLATIAGLLALLLVMLVLPAFNTLVGTELALPYNNMMFWAALAGIIIITGLLAGSYPALFLSSFNPVGVLKGAYKRTGKAFNPRKALVVFQFCIAIVLIISTVVVSKQIRFARDRNAGYTGNRLMYHWITQGLDKNFEQVKHELLSSGIAESVTRTASQLTAQFSSTSDVKWKGKSEDNTTDFERGAQDQGLVTTAGLKLVKGRDLDLAAFPTDSTAMLINTSAAKVMGFDDPIGQIVTDGGQEYHVVGVFEDYIFGSPYENTRPMVILGPKDMLFNIIHMRLAETSDVVAQIEAVGTIFKKYNPDYPYEYHFVDQDYAQKFADMQRTAGLTALFAALTIIISCLGLFGLASYMAEARIKEIGIRKVLGASALRITALVSKDFLVLVGMAILIACPIAWYAMNSWLSSYVYRTPLEWWVFAGTGVLVIALSVLTVGYHAIKAVLANPVKSLRTE